jgi:hypothetical protein
MPGPRGLLSLPRGESRLPAQSRPVGSVRPAGRILGGPRLPRRSGQSALLPLVSTSPQGLGRGRRPRPGSSGALKIPMPTLTNCGGQATPMSEIGSRPIAAVTTRLYIAAAANVRLRATILPGSHRTKAGRRSILATKAALLCGRGPRLGLAGGWCDAVNMFECARCVWAVYLFISLLGLLFLFGHNLRIPCISVPPISKFVVATRRCAKILLTL